MTALATPPKLQFLDSNGAPLVGGKLYTYAAGTTTPLTTYTDFGGVTANANPVILDSRGEASVWLGTSLYKMALYSATDVLIWTVDNIDGFATLTQLAALQAQVTPLQAQVTALQAQVTALQAQDANLTALVSINGGQIAGLRNRVINGNMGIFQRGTTAVTTNAGYGPADRWRTDVVGDTFSTTQGSFVSGDTLYDTGSAQYFTQIAVTSVANTANYCTWQQQIEDVRVLAGQTVTVSFWAKAASGTPSIAVEIVQVFGTGGSPSANVTGTGQAQALTTTWTKYSKTFTVPSINSKTIGTDPNTSATVINFWLDAGATYNTRANSIGQVSKTVSIAQVQTEVGSVATVFEQRPIGLELALCQRYYNVISSRGNDLFLYQAASQANTFVATIAYPVTMRTTPATTTITGTVTYTNASALNAVPTANYVALRCNVTAAGIYSVSTYGITNSAEL